MSTFQDLPDELILKILSYSEIKALITCGQVSKRIRTISHDNSLWETVSFEKKILKTELLEMILEMGCRTLNISNFTILGSLSSNIKSQLRVLNLSQPVTYNCVYPGRFSTIIPVLETLLSSCRFLQHLTIEGLWLTPEMAKNICKNGKTLEILSMTDSSVNDLRYSIKTKSSYLQYILEYCQELKEINFNELEGLSNENLIVLAKYIPPNVEKLNLSGLNLMNAHVSILLSRCNKIKKLSLEATLIGDNSLTNIEHHLKHTLEELSLGENAYISGKGFLQLKSMPRLKFLNIYDETIDFKKIQDLRQHLPHLMIRTS